ncbi:DUF1601 domain-containing protein [Pedobacter sp. Leaf250]
MEIRKQYLQAQPLNQLLLQAIILFYHLITQAKVL